jgi:hypothetical protein
MATFAKALSSQENNNCEANLVLVNKTLSMYLQVFSLYFPLFFIILKSIPYLPTPSESLNSSFVQKSPFF